MTMLQTGELGGTSSPWRTIVVLMLRVLPSRNRDRALLCWLLFFALGAGLTSSSLSNPWFGDELHLVRPFTAPELRGAFTGPWDPDGVETPGYRPLSVM